MTMMTYAQRRAVTHELACLIEKAAGAIAGLPTEGGDGLIESLDRMAVDLSEARRIASDPASDWPDE